MMGCAGMVGSNVRQGRERRLEGMWGGEETDEDRREDLVKVDCGSLYRFASWKKELHTRVEIESREECSVEEGSE